MYCVFEHRRFLFFSIFDRDKRSFSGVRGSVQRWHHHEVPITSSFSHHPTQLGQCSWIPRDSVAEPIGCSTPLATSFMPIHGIVYCLSYYPSCTKVQDQCDDYYRQIPGQENVSIDHTVHVIVVADRLRRRPGIHRIQPSRLSPVG